MSIRFRRNGVIAAAAAVLIVLTTALPAHAVIAKGFRSCVAPKSVSLFSATTGTSMFHTYKASAQSFYSTREPGVANVIFNRRTYGAPTSTDWEIYAQDRIWQHSASCV